MAAKVTCPYCYRETNGATLLDNLKSFFTLSANQGLTGSSGGGISMGSNWVGLKCSKCGNEFDYNKETHETTRETHLR